MLTLAVKGIGRNWILAWYYIWQSGLGLCYWKGRGET
jgi:hypothetical protein